MRIKVHYTEQCAFLYFFVSGRDFKVCYDEFKEQLNSRRLDVEQNNVWAEEMTEGSE